MLRGIAEEHVDTMQQDNRQHDEKQFAPVLLFDDDIESERRQHHISQRIEAQDAEHTLLGGDDEVPLLITVIGRQEFCSCHPEHENGCCYESQTHDDRQCKSPFDRLPHIDEHGQNRRQYDGNVEAQDDSQGKKGSR